MAEVLESPVTVYGCENWMVKKVIGKKWKYGVAGELNRHLDLLKNKQVGPKVNEA